MLLHAGECMRDYFKSILIATAIASIFFPWIIKYDVPYPGVMYEQYIWGYENACGWISVSLACVLAVFELWFIKGNKKIASFLRVTCCIVGVLCTAVYSICMVLFENYDVIRPFIGIFVSMISFGLLLLNFSGEKADE